MTGLARFAASFGRCIIVAAIALAASPAYSQQLRDITIGLPSTSLASALPRIAHEMGIFAKNGLDAKFVVMDNASIATAALVAGSVKLTVAGPGELVAAQANGRKVVSVATTYGGLSTTLVVSKAVADKLAVAPNASIKERLKALDGLVIAGASPTSAATVAFKGASKDVGVDLRSTFMNQQTMPAALESGAIQGFVASAPFWALPVTRGTGVVWIAGRELPPEYSPVSAGILQTMHDFAQANPDLMKTLVQTFADFADAVGTRPAAVKAAIAKLYPDLEARTIDLFFDSESPSWRAKPPTAQDMVREIAFMKMSGTSLQNLDRLDPAAMVYP